MAQNKHIKYDEEPKDKDSEEHEQLKKFMIRTSKAQELIRSIIVNTGRLHKYIAELPNAIADKEKSIFFYIFNFFSFLARNRKNN